MYSVTISFFDEARLCRLVKISFRIFHGGHKNCVLMTSRFISYSLKIHVYISLSEIHVYLIFVEIRVFSVQMTGSFPCDIKYKRDRHTSTPLQMSSCDSTHACFMDFGKTCIRVKNCLSSIDPLTKK